MRISDWVKLKPVWAKSPAVFLFLA